MADKIEEVKTYKINEVEVFAAGKWNNDEYTVADLYKIVDSFTALKIGFRPYLKLGHDDKQRLAKSSGLPSVGWVENLYVRGTKLLADLNYIPEKVYKLIKARAYRKVSCEIYWNLTVENTKYDRVLGGIAFLGAENPGVMILDDILGNYSFINTNNAETLALFDKQEDYKTYSQDINTNLEGPMADEKSEKELSLEQELETVKKEFSLKDEELKKLADEKSAAEKEIADLKQFKLEAEQREQEALVKAEEAKRAQYVTELESKKLVTPAMKPLVEQFLTNKKEYSLENKTYSHEALFEEILKLATEASKINFEEASRADFGKAKEGEDELIEKYMKDNKCSYVQAYKAVMKDKK